MARPSDWDVLDLSADPTPGDPTVVAGLGREWDRVADDADAAERGVRSLASDGAVLEWLGMAGDSFKGPLADFPSQLGKCKDSYREGASALHTWSSDLAGAQSDADRALQLGREARADLDSAHSALGSAQSSASTAATSASTAQQVAATYTQTPPPAGVTVPSADAVRTAVRTAQIAQSRVFDARAAVGDAQSRLDAARRLALDAKQMRESRGTAAARRIDDASEAGIKPSSFLEDLGQLAAKVWDATIKVAKVVVAVLGIVALIVGGPLAWVVFAAAVLVLADTIAKATQGKASGWDIAFAALNCIPGTKGLTTAGKVVDAFKDGGSLLRGTANVASHLAGAGKAAVGEIVGPGRALLSKGASAVTSMASAVRGLGQGATTYMKSLATEGALAASLTLTRLKPARSVADELGQNIPTIEKFDRTPVLTTPDLAKHHDWRPLMGALNKPRTGYVGRLLGGYDPLGGMKSASDFLESFTNGWGRWKYPPLHGFEGPSAVVRHKVGTLLDRFGEEGGAYLSPAGTPYAERAIPPSNLDPLAPNFGYHQYEVVRPFDAHTGAIAPAFGQPGKGLQLMLDGRLIEGAPDRVDVKWLLNNGYLRELRVAAPA